MNWNESVTGNAMMASSSISGRLDAKSLTTMTKKQSQNEYLYMFTPADSDITMWSFEWTEENDLYYLKTTGNGSTEYLSITDSGLSLVATTPTDSCKLQVVPGTGTDAGKICLKQGDITLTYSGTVAGGFTVGGIAGSEWLYLVESTDLTSDYLRTWSANKVSVSDPSVTNGSRVIVYARVWNDATKKYEFYAIDHDGSLVRCFESGDHIEWLAGQLNTQLWNLVEYYWEDDTNRPNGFFELYNQYSDRYIAPQVTGGQILSDTIIGINLTGRTDGYYHTPIVAWDEENYAYVGLKADIDAGKIVACPLDEAGDFYFATMYDIPVDDTINIVPTVEHTQYGIKMRIIDYQTAGNYNGQVTSKEQHDVLGTNKWASGQYKPGLLSTKLESNGYPTVNSNNKSLQQLYNGAKDVNHLFIASTYSGTGYYEFDSTQNYAHLEENGNFTVYKQIATHDAGSKKTLTHGQFFPFNTIEAGKFASVNKKNTTDVYGDDLRDDDPRKNERLYLINNPNYYFGVEIEASFTQTSNGLDAWGHDIIYEFTGDDDFWLYVDGELVIDLGGIHSAMHGSVNFATGSVSGGPQNAGNTLREIFRANFIARGGSESDADAYVNERFKQNAAGDYVFKDNTSHTMKIFYMERGAGASNLHMRFNLASVKPGTVELSKKLSMQDPVDKLDSTVYAEYPYQVYYREGAKGSVQLTSSLSGELTWSTSNVQAAEVNNDGHVEAKAGGTATITASNGAENENFDVSVMVVDGIKYLTVYKNGCLLEEYLESESNAHLLGDTEGEEDAINFKNSSTIIPIKSTFSIPRTSITYERVFLLKPGQTAVINLPEQAAVYKIVECGVNTNVYSNVKVNGNNVTGVDITYPDPENQGSNLSDPTRKDYPTDWATSVDVSRVEYDNEVRKLRTLTIKKVLFDVEGNNIDNISRTDNAEFSFRLYLATEYDENINSLPANMQPYHVKDPSGNYCRWNAASQSFVSLGTSDYGSLTSEQKSAATFNTSMNGTISRIRAGYSVEFRNLLPGTQYRVEERPWEIPDGYSFKTYVFDDNTAKLVDRNSGSDTVSGVVGTMVANEESTVEVHNFKGFGLRVNKTWMDAMFMQSRADVYFAVFTTATGTEGEEILTLVDSSVKKLSYGEDSVYWYYNSLPVPDVTDFSNYVVREVELTNPQVADDGTVTSFDNYTVCSDRAQITLSGRQIGESADSNFVYTVLYSPVQTSADSNVRVFPVTNDRPSIRLYKTDWSGEALAGAKFRLEESGGSEIGTFTSDQEGFLTFVFLGSDKTYKLTELSSPQGYHAMEGEMTITITGNNVTINGVDSTNYTRIEATTTEPLTLKIKNRPYTFSVVKEGEQPDGTMAKQEGVYFALYKKITVDGISTFGTDPLSGYDNLVTDANGVVPKLNNTLAPGDYELREKASLTGYYALSSYIYFSVSETGVITLGDHPADVSLTGAVNPSADTMEYTITILNRLIPPSPTGYRVKSRPFGWMALAGLALMMGAALSVKRRRHEA